MSCKTELHCCPSLLEIPYKYGSRGRLTDGHHSTAQQPELWANLSINTLRKLDPDSFQPHRYAVLPR